MDDNFPSSILWRMSEDRTEEWDEEEWSGLMAKGDDKERGKWARWDGKMKKTSMESEGED